MSMTVEVLAAVSSGIPKSVGNAPLAQLPTPSRQGGKGEDDHRTRGLGEHRQRDVVEASVAGEAAEVVDAGADLGAGGVGGDDVLEREGLVRGGQRRGGEIQGERAAEELAGGVEEGDLAEEVAAFIGRGDGGGEAEWAGGDDAAGDRL